MLIENHRSGVRPKCDSLKASTERSSLRRKGVKSRKAAERNRHVLLGRHRKLGIKEKTEGARVGIVRVCGGESGGVSERNISSRMTAIKISRNRPSRGIVKYTSGISNQSSVIAWAKSIKLLLNSVALNVIMAMARNKLALLHAPACVRNCSA